MSQEEDRQRLYGIINADPIVTSLLYDLNLLPEQTAGDPVRYRQTQTVVHHMMLVKARERERALADPDSPPVPTL